MKPFRIAVLLTVVAICQAASAASVGDRFGRLPLTFEQNTGQIDHEILFVSRDPARRVFLTRSGATLALESGDGSAVIALEPVGGALDLTVTGEERATAISRYYGPGTEHTAPHFARVRYKEVYPGIDWVFRGDPRRLEYDFVVRPGSDPAQVRLRIRGAESLALLDGGALAIATAAGELRMLAPVAFQQVEGERRSVSAAFRLESGDTIAFALGAYDADEELVIDPVLSYAGYLGGSGADLPADIVVSESGEAYVVGMTRSLDFPVTPGPRPDPSTDTCVSGIAAKRCFDLFAAKLNATGTQLEWSVFYGGGADETAADADLAPDGSLWIVGTTRSRNFPTTPGAAQTGERDAARDDADGFVLRLGADGMRQAATLLGGSNADEAVGVAAREDGAVAVGHTESADLPTDPGAYQPRKAGAPERSDVFVALVSGDAGRVEATYLGGRSDDRAGGVDLDNDGRIFVTGAVGSADFPVSPDALRPQPASDASDAFLAVLRGIGELVYADRFGGRGVDAGTRIEVDTRGRAYVLGSTDSRDLPTTRDAALPVWKRSLSFLARFNRLGDEPDYVTYLVGSSRDLAVDAEFNAWIAGVRGGPASPFGGPLVPGCNGSVLRKLDPSGSRLLFSGFVPGLGEIDVDGRGFVYTAGEDRSGLLPTTAGSFSTRHSGQSDVYLAKMEIGGQDRASITCVENGASFFPGEAAPGQLMTLFGSGLGPQTPAFLEVDGGMVTTELGGVRVLFDGVPAPLLYAQFNQLNVVAPYAIEGKTSTTIQVERDGVLSEEFDAPVADAHPGLFTRSSTGEGLAALLNQDGSINSVENPAQPGEVVSLFGTGEGQTEPAGIDGLVAPETLAGLARPRLPLRVLIGEREAEVQYGGAAPGFVSGVLQVNVRVPSDAPAGLLPVRLTVGSRFNRQPVFVAVE